MKEASCNVSRYTRHFSWYKKGTMKDNHSRDGGVEVKLKLETQNLPCQAPNPKEKDLIDVAPQTKLSFSFQKSSVDYLSGPQQILKLS